MLLVERAEDRHLHAAGPAPTRPEADDEVLFAVIIRERDGVAIEGGEREGGAVLLTSGEISPRSCMARSRDLARQVINTVKTASVTMAMMAAGDGFSFMSGHL